VPNKEHVPSAPGDFIRDIVAQHVAEKKYPQIHTRFPPEPNGYLHIGHAKSICLNFGVAREFGGLCNLRYDDTNPTKEEVEYVDSIFEDVNWLIKGWADHCLGLKPKGKVPGVQTVKGNQDFQIPAAADPSQTLEPFYASDYFDPLYEYAVQLVKKGVAYVCDLSPEDTDKYRGAPDRPGKDSPFRNRPIEENLDLFARMKAGEFPDGAKTLRAKIDMQAANVWLRDPVLYRIRHAEHHHTGGKWCIYPMYDWAHTLSDYIEGITHSLCTLEFEVHRPLYEWTLQSLEFDLARDGRRQFERLQNPFVKRPMHFELERAERMGDALDVIAQGVGPIVHRINAPFAAGVMMFGVANPIEDRIAQPDVRRLHVDLRPQGFRAIRKLARFHARKQIEIFFDRPIAKRT